MRAFSVALAAVLVLCLPWMLSGCGGSSGDQPLGAKDAANGSPWTDLIAGASAGADAGNAGWDAGDVYVEGNADGLTVTVVLDDTTYPDIAFTDDVKVWVGTSAPASDDWIPGHMPYTLTVSGTTAYGSFDPPGSGADNLYMMLHTVVSTGDGDGGGTVTWTGTATTYGTGIMWVGQNDIGATYDMHVDGDQLFICIHAPEGWTIGLVHFWFGGVDEFPPMNKQGKRVPGQYPYQYDAGMVQDYCIVFNLTDLGFTEGEETCSDFKGSLHAEFSDDGWVTHQTGWAEQPEEWNDGADFLFEVCTHNEYGGGGGEGTTDTAFAYDFTSGPYPGGDPDPELGYFEIFPWSDGGTVKRWGWVFYFPASPGTPWT